MADFVVSIRDGVVWLMDADRTFAARVRNGVASSPGETEVLGAKVDDVEIVDFVGVP